MDLLELHRLRTYFRTDEGVLKAVDGVSYSIPMGGTIGIIGESGCGKSVTARSILRIVPPPGYIAGGSIVLDRAASAGRAEHRSTDNSTMIDSVDLARLDPKGPLIRAIRGRLISMIFQEPMSSLSPVHTVGNQIIEAILLHRTGDKVEARGIALDMLARVGMSNPGQRIDEYPYQLSGGMRQRAMIAMALSCNPALLIADEPTTALDVTVQAQILRLIKDLQAEFGMSIQFITHDLGVIAEMAENVAVMYQGRIVERGTAHQVFKESLHPYTRLLLTSVPKLGTKSRERLEAIKGTVPTPLDPPRQCGFYGRCPAAMAGTCDVEVPELVDMDGGHSVRCYLHNSDTELPSGKQRDEEDRRTDSEQEDVPV